MIALRDIRPGAYVKADVKTPNCDTRVPSLFEITAVDLDWRKGEAVKGNVAIVNCSTEAPALVEASVFMREYDLVRAADHDIPVAA